MREGAALILSGNWGTPSARTSFFVSIAFFFALLGHNIFKAWGQFSAIQILICLAGLLLFRGSTAWRVCLSIAAILLVSLVQFAAINPLIDPGEFNGYLITYPILACLLIGFLYLSAHLVVRGYISIDAVEMIAWLVLVVSFVAAVVARLNDTTYFPQIFYDNPNESSVAVSGAYLYLAFKSRYRGAYVVALLLAVSAVYLGSARFSMLYLGGIFLLAAMPRVRAASAQQGDAVGQIAIALALAALAIDLSVLNGFFELSDYEKFGIRPEALWLAWDASAPAISSIGYRINNVLAAAGSLVRTFGLGIGLGRSAPMVGQISGEPGSIHVSPVEFLIELGIFGSAALIYVGAKGHSLVSVRTFMFWMFIGMLGMAAQSSAYLTSYIAWFFIVVLATLKADEANTHRSHF